MLCYIYARLPKCEVIVPLYKLKVSYYIYFIRELPIYLYTLHYDCVLKVNYNLRSLCFYIYTRISLRVPHQVTTIKSIRVIMIYYDYYTTMQTDNYIDTKHLNQF